MIRRAWLERGYDIFRKGGAKASDVEALVQQSHQLMWGEDKVQEGVPDLVNRLKEAQSWAQKARYRTFWASLQSLSSITSKINTAFSSIGWSSLQIETTFRMYLQL